MEGENERGPSLHTILRIGEATCWFSPIMKRKEVRLSIGDIGYTSRVNVLDECQSLIHLTLPKPSRPRFLSGDLATLKNQEGQRRWSGCGKISSVNEDESKEGQTSRDTVLEICAPIRWPSSIAKEQEMRLFVNDFDYTGRVEFEDELKTSLRFKLPTPPHRCFVKGGLAALQTKEARRWSCEIISGEEDKDNKGEEHP
jgi:hypothetical protein